jgi:hypothetical protein
MPRMQPCYFLCFFLQVVHNCISGDEVSEVMFVFSECILIYLVVTHELF